LTIVAAADAFVVQEHQTNEKANHELPTELQTIHIAHSHNQFNNNDALLFVTFYTISF